MPEYREAKAEKRSYKKLHGMHIAKTGSGHIVTHHHKDGGNMVMPKEHAFSKEDGEDGTTHAHISEHLKAMGIHMKEMAKEEAGEEE